MMIISQIDNFKMREIFILSRKKIKLKFKEIIYS